MGILTKKNNRKIERIIYDVYQTKIEEIETWYNKGLLKLDPIYQRKYRWELHKKTKLIESIFLGLPLPAIFLFHNTTEDTYEVIDGQQRLSTILEFLGNKGIDKDINEDDKIYNKGLQIDKNIDSFSFIDDLLIGITGIDNGKGLKYLDDDDLKKFKEYRLTLIVIDDIKKLNHYIFYVLNRGGLGLNDQEIRNNFILSRSEGFFKSLEKIVKELLDEGLLTYDEKSIQEFKHYYNFIKFYILFFYVYKGEKFTKLEGSGIDEILIGGINKIKSTNRVTLKEQKEIKRTYNIAMEILGKPINNFNMTVIDFMLHGIYNNYDKMKFFNLKKHKTFQDKVLKYIQSKDFKKISSGRINTKEKMIFGITKGIDFFSKFKK